MIASISKSEADYRKLREAAGRPSQSAVAFADLQEAGTAIRWRHPRTVVYEGQVRESGSWQELVGGEAGARLLMLVVPRHADERLWAEILNLAGLDRRLPVTGFFCV